MFACACAAGLRAQPDSATRYHPEIPKTWDDAAMATIEVPLANAIASAKHVSADYYYKIPVRPIYKMYPIYAPDREPKGYMDWLRQQEPVIIWDDKGHSPALATETDWIRAGEIVFDAPVVFGPPAGYTIPEVRDPEWYRKSGVPVTKDGVMPFFYYAIREKGTVEVAAFGCGTCHTRVMPDGTALKGPQGNFPVDRTFADVFRRGPVDRRPNDTARRLWGAVAQARSVGWTRQAIAA
jgi:hypothetical protein